MKIVVFGLTLSSSWGNGHATTYRSLLKALARDGHKITFIEKDAEGYRSNRDLPDPEFCTLRLYDDWSLDYHSLVCSCLDADAIVIGSYYPDAIRATMALLDLGCGPLLFYDIDTPVTLAQLRTYGRTEYLDPALIPYYDAYLSFTGGPVLRELTERFGATWAVPFYCSVDSSLHRPVPARPRFQCDLSYIGTYAPDRQPSLNYLLGGTASRLPSAQFIVAGSKYPIQVKWQSNVRRIVHIAPGDHAAFYSSSRFTLNLTRSDMIAAGYSPSVRLFEASACATAILSDCWPGLEEFLTPGDEILNPSGPKEVADILCNLLESDCVRLGRRARERVLAEHSSSHRAAQFAEVVAGCSRRNNAAVRLRA